jgi:starch synthase
MYIVHLTTELAPLAKVGGLGDVTAGLSKALTEEGEKVEVILPFYDHIDRKLLKKLEVDFEDLLSYEDLEEVKNTVWSAEFDGISLILIEPHSEAGYFERGVIYGEEDDLFRFTYFTKTAMEYLLKRGKHPDILNIHDWLTSLAAPLYRETYQSLGLKIGGIMTTIHNMKYQGTCVPQKIERLGLKTDHLITKDKMQDHKNPKKLNLLKGALVFSDSLTTVSPTYAEEIQGKEGFGLDPLLVENKGKLRGILNGIDTSYWNPETDPFLEQNYQTDGINLDEVIKAKTENRKSLQQKLHMDYDPAPLFISVTRIVEQKGPEMIRFGIEYVLKKGGQFILLGSTPEPTLKAEFYALAEEYRDNPHVHFHFIFDEQLAHLTFASADCIIIPSLFEPCGLTQMISLRYGTIPIVHKVGGLNDTVFDIDHDTIPLDRRNGYTFDFPSEDSLRWSIDRAFEHHRNDPKKWKLMLKNGFQKDWSWKTPALEYLEAYRSV